MLDVAEQRVINALERLAAAKTRFQVIRPEPSEDLVLASHRHTGFYFYSERECDLEGSDLWPKGPPCRPPRQIVSSALLKQAIKNGNLYADRRTKFGKQVYRLIATAEKHEASIAAAQEAVNADAVMTEAYRASCDVGRLARLIRRVPARTMEGVMIKARMVVVHAYGDKNARHCAGGWWGLPMAEEMLRIGNCDPRWQRLRAIDAANREAA